MPFPRLTPVVYVGLLAGLLHGTMAVAQPKWTDGVLTDPAGLPLYTSERESEHKSQCYGACLNVWYPLRAAEGAAAFGEFTVFKRDDGVSQWAYKGKPLYLWWNAERPMDGVGMAGGNWQVVKLPK